MTTFVAGQRVTAAALNSNTVAYTPVWGSSGTQPAIGNGTILGSYATAGQLVFFTIYMLGGSTTTGGTGNYSLTLPLTSKTSTGIVGSYSGILDHSGAAAGMCTGNVLSAQTTIGIASGGPPGLVYISVAVAGNPMQWTASAPFAISGANFTFQVAGWYETA